MKHQTKNTKYVTKNNLTKNINNQKLDLWTEVKSKNLLDKSVAEYKALYVPTYKTLLDEQKEKLHWEDKSYYFEYNNPPPMNDSDENYYYDVEELEYYEQDDYYLSAKTYQDEPDEPDYYGYYGFLEDDEDRFLEEEDERVKHIFDYEPDYDPEAYHHCRTFRPIF